MKPRCSQKKTGGRDPAGHGAPNLVTISGIVVPVDWDQKGNIIELAISTLNEEEYFVHKNDKGQELMSHIRKMVEIRGLVQREQDRKVIRVEDFDLTLQ